MYRNRTWRNGARGFKSGLPQYIYADEILSSESNDDWFDSLDLIEASSSSVFEPQNFDDRYASKRPKLEQQSFTQDGDCHLASLVYSDTDGCRYLRRDYNTNNSTVKNDINHLSPVLSDGINGNPLDYKSGKDDEGDGSRTPKVEALEFRMYLNDDLLHMVFSFLDHISLSRAAQVCRQWRAASTHEDFWRALNFENRNISFQQFENMCHRYPNASSLNIDGAPAIYLLGMTALSSLRNLKALTLGKGQLKESFFQALTDCQKLTSLMVNEVTLSNGSQEMPICHDRLCQLQIVKCQMLRVYVRCPQLLTLSLKRSSMEHAMLNCPLLRDLDIESCHNLSDASIRSLVTSCPLLESLDMSNCSCVSEETLHEISFACANLHFLNASYCPNISFEFVRLPMLKVLRLHCCAGINTTSMASISLSYMLEVLELDNCSLLTTVSLDLPHLQKIRLVHCRKLTVLNLRTMMLSSVRVSNCPLLQQINIISNSLQKLALQKQERLTALALQCQCLVEVDLTDCEALTNSICEVFSTGGGCPMLKSLILDNCEKLTEVQFCSTTLVSLSLAGCYAISSIELSCPYLEQISLNGCDLLERASFCPVGLRSLNLGIFPMLNSLHIEAPLMVLLEMKGCGVLSEASINCPLLKYLDASFCSQLKDDYLSSTTASFPLIKSLILMSCPSVVGSDGLMALRRLPHLTLLDLSYTFLRNLQPVFESCSQLKVLRLQACKYLANSSLEPLYNDGALPTLRELDLSYGTLCKSSIEALLSCCTRLSHVSLNGCANMHDLNWGHSDDHLSKLNLPVAQPNRLLQNLNCVGCPNIKKVVIPSIARWFNLSLLNLSLSVNLREVDVACSNLCSLNLSNCCSLKILKLECPRLTSLFLQSCNIDEEEVEAAIAPCNMLETVDVRFCPKICSMNVGRLRTACPSLKRISSSLAPTFK